MTDYIYQTLKSALAEYRGGDRYERFTREIGGAQGHLLVNYEGGQERVEVVLKKEKERHERIMVALEWLEEQNRFARSSDQFKPETKDATKEGSEPGDSLPEHTGDGKSGTPTETSGSSSAIHSTQKQQQNQTLWQKQEKGVQDVRPEVKTKSSAQQSHKKHH